MEVPTNHRSGVIREINAAIGEVYRTCLQCDIDDEETMFCDFTVDFDGFPYLLKIIYTHSLEYHNTSYEIISYEYISFGYYLALKAIGDDSVDELFEDMSVPPKICLN